MPLTCVYVPYCSWLRRCVVDSTKDKMDTLIDKLYAGKEANNSLSGAIAAAASGYQQVRGGHSVWRIKSVCA